MPKSPPSERPDPDFPEILPSWARLRRHRLAAECRKIVVVAVVRRQRRAAAPCRHVDNILGGSKLWVESTVSGRPVWSGAWNYPRAASDVAEKRVRNGEKWTPSGSVWIQESEQRRITVCSEEGFNGTKDWRSIERVTRLSFKIFRK